MQPIRTVPAFCSGLLLLASAAWAQVVPEYSSLPGASHTLYLDFNGINYPGNWSGKTPGNVPAYNLDGDPSTFNSTELSHIFNIWSRVAEMYSPFDINITTVAPGGNPAANQWSQIVISQGTWYGQAGGVAIMYGFSSGGLHNGTGWAFPNYLGNTPKNIAIAAAHEAGHQFGLNHQSWYNASGVLIQEYRRSQDGNKTAPTMGDSYSAVRSLWSNEIAHGNRPQDDMAILAGRLGYRADESNHSFATALAMTPGSLLSVTGSGLIKDMAEVDLFSFQAIGDRVDMGVYHNQFGGMLDAKLMIYNASGDLLATIDEPLTTSGSGDRPSYGLDATFTRTLAPGTYFVAVASHGSYGDVGTYSVEGTVGDAINPCWVAGIDHWKINSNWSLGAAPASNVGGRINNGGTAQILAGDDITVDYITLGETDVDTGTLDINGGSLTTNNLNVGQAGSGVFNLNGGSLLAPQVNVATHGGAGELHLNGGTLTTDRIRGSNGDSTLYLNGATIKVRTSNSGSLIESFAHARLQAGGVTIDTSGFFKTITASLEDDPTSPGGGLVKVNNGKLTLAAANTYTGVTSVGANKSGQIIFAHALAVQNSTVDNGKLDGVTFAAGIGAFTFGGLAGGGDLTLSDGSSAVTLRVGNNNNDTTYAGRFGGNGALVKIGNGTLTLTADHAYTGPTTIESGTLAVNGSLAAGSTVTVTGGALRGTGAIHGSVTVQANGTLAPGNSIGTMTLYNALTLDGQTIMEIHKLGLLLDNDLLTGITLLTLGGNLTVTQTGDAPMTGDIWDLFNANTFTGHFDGYDLPTLRNGLSWDTSHLSIDGTLRVIPEPSSLLLACGLIMGWLNIRGGHRNRSAKNFHNPPRSTCFGVI